MPKVTAIINLCNGKATLAEAIDSVLAQTFSDWELLIWDDASSDGGLEVVDQYDDERIRYIRSEVRIPLGQARQQAINAAHGEWIAFLDQDDLWMPRKLELQLARSNQAPNAALIYGRTVRFYSSGSERDYDQAHEYASLPEGDIFRDLFISSCFIAMSSAMFRRSALEEIGGIPESIAIIPDYYLYTAMARRFPAAAVQGVVCRYRMHSSSTLHNNPIAVHEEALRLMALWQKEVEPKVLARCRRDHATQVALAEMRAPRTFLRGLRRLLPDGSVFSQLLRPFYYLFHLVRRNVFPPYWKTITVSTSRNS